MTRRKFPTFACFLEEYRVRRQQDHELLAEDEVSPPFIGVRDLTAGDKLLVSLTRVKEWVSAHDPKDERQAAIAAHLMSIRGRKKLFGHKSGTHVSGLPVAPL